MTPPYISVVITTRNRQKDLRRALRSCESQEDVSFEVLVYDDASDDGTDKMVREEFPTVRLLRREQRAGLIVRRNEGFRDAMSNILVSLDDDAFLTGPTTLRRIVELFEKWPKTAAFALPYVEPNALPNVTMMPLTSSDTELRGFIGCAHAIRRDIALQFGGYPELLVHQGEERDMCIRLIDNGWDIRYADTAQIVHLYSPLREQARVNHYGYRNAILFCWMRMPFPECLGAAALTTLKLLRHRFSFSSLLSRLYSLSAGWFGAWRFRSARAPVSRATFKKYYNLPGHGPSPLTDSERISFIEMADNV